MKLETIYIGYDPGEEQAFRVLVESILEHSSRVLNIVPIKKVPLVHSGLFKRTSINMIDSVDGRPFSTDFSFTRFLVPFLNQNEGLALFIDSDMYFRSDPALIFDEYDGKSAIQVVKHDYQTSESTKMDGRAQQNYSRKNWSSVVLWDCGHKAHLELTVDDVNTRTGRWLHNFMWLYGDDIGELSPSWNYLVGHTDDTIEPSLVHFTAGIPTYESCNPRPGKDMLYVKEWLQLATSPESLPSKQPLATLQ